MGYHTFPIENADRLEDAAFRYRHLSAEELLWLLSPSGSDVVADLGSGTGFYTDDLAPHVAQAYAVDVQKAMHDYYREKGVPDTVKLITAEIGDLPFETDALDAAVSTMTYHEFASSEALQEISRVVDSGGRLVVADWTADGSGDAGPPIDERYTLDEASAALRDNEFEVERAATRPETFVLVGRHE